LVSCDPDTLTIVAVVTPGDPEYATLAKAFLATGKWKE
jgi:hypothetical protein